MNCKLCGNFTKTLFDDGKDYFVNQGNSPDFGIEFCEHCKIGYTTPELTDEQLSQYYPDDFEAYVQKKSFKSFIQTLKYQSDIRLIQKNSGNQHKLTVYEIGAGRGEFLYNARKAGFIVSGSEPGQSGVNCALEQFNIHLDTQFADDIVFNQKYDIIVMRHVLEHLNNFDAVLKNICENGLNEDGMLFIKVPQASSKEADKYQQYWHGYDLPRHRVHFTKKGLINLLREIGLNQFHFKNEVVPYCKMRSIRYKATLHRKNNLFLKLPTILQIIFAQLIGYYNLCLFGNAGRMILIAKK